MSFTRIKDTNLAHWKQPESLKANYLFPGLTPKESDLIGLRSSLGVEEFRASRRF